MSPTLANEAMEVPAAKEAKSLDDNDKDEDVIMLTTTVTATNDHSMHVSTGIVGGQSEMLKTMLCNGRMLESVDRSQPVVIKVKDEADAKVHEAMIRFFYTGELPTTATALFELVQVGNHYLAHGLVDECHRQLQDRMTEEVAMQVLDFGERVQLSPALQRVVDLARTWIATQYRDVDKHMDKLLAMPPHRLCHVLSSDRLNVQSENEVFEFVCKWNVKNKTEDHWPEWKLHVRQQVFACIRWENIGHDYFRQNVLNAKGVLDKLPVEAIMFHLLPLDQQQAVAEYRKLQRRDGYHLHPTTSVEWKMSLSDMKHDPEFVSSREPGTSPTMFITGLALACDLRPNAEGNPLGRPMLFINAPELLWHPEATNVNFTMRCHVRRTDGARAFEQTNAGQKGTYFFSAKGQVRCPGFYLFLDKRWTWQELLDGRYPEYVDAQRNIEVRVTVEVHEQAWWKTTP